ncbi:MAG: hypothetical protein PHF86_03300 [Candidatus Nanoarchaeia archaeon]|jgi:hypothetical protein|nr:hypothetical protein [Candidatus Nanoarchaeia archaeon]
MKLTEKEITNIIKFFLVFLGLLGILLPYMATLSFKEYVSILVGIILFSFGLSEGHN